MARLNINGSFDTTFDGDGMASPGGNAVAIQPDGKIVIGTGRSDPGNNLDFAISRLNPNGSLDTGFGTNGVVQTDIGFTQNGEIYTRDTLKEIVLQPNGKIVAVGSARSMQGTGATDAVVFAITQTERSIRVSAATELQPLIFLSTNILMLAKTLPFNRTAK